MTLRLPPLEHSRSLRYATVFALYLMQGLPAGFALTAVANRLAAEHGGTRGIEGLSLALSWSAAIPGRP